MGLNQDLWSNYGFRNNPFDTTALTLYTDSLFPISGTYVGRGVKSRESQLFSNSIKSAGGNRVVVEGEIGVGKTTFVNYQRHIWEKEADDILFTPSGELSFSNEWNRTEFLINVLSQITSKLYLLYGEELPENNDLFQELLLLNKVFVEESTDWQFNIFSVGAGLGRDKQISIPMIPEAKLYDYFREIVRTILKLGYSGVILHFDDLELAQRQDLDKTKKVFDEIRNLLQVPNVYYIFVAKTGFFNSVISPLERVRSIFFGWPIFLKPLSPEEVIKVINIRYDFLAIEKERKNYRKPIEEDFVHYLYNLYEGKIRFIMDAIHGVISYFPANTSQTIGFDKAKKLLKSMALEKIQNVFTKRELDVLLEMVKMGEFTNLDLTKRLGLQKQNVSKYINYIRNTGHIRFVRKEEKKTIYTLSEDILYLHSMIKNEKLTFPLPSPRTSTPDPFSSLNERQKKFIKSAELGTTITTLQHAKKYQVSRPTASRDLTGLEKLGYIERFGKRKGTYYEVIKKPKGRRKKKTLP